MANEAQSQDTAAAAMPAAATPEEVTQAAHETPAAQTVEHAHFGLKIVLLAFALVAVGVVIYLAATL